MKIGIIGLSYVGSPLVIQLAKSIAVIQGIDAGKEKVGAFSYGSVRGLDGILFDKLAIG